MDDIQKIDLGWVSFIYVAHVLQWGWRMVFYTRSSLPSMQDWLSWAPHFLVGHLLGFLFRHLNFLDLLPVMDICRSFKLLPPMMELQLFYNCRLPWPPSQSNEAGRNNILLFQTGLNWENSLGRSMGSLSCVGFGAPFQCLEACQSTLSKHLCLSWVTPSLRFLDVLFESQILSFPV